MSVHSSEVHYITEGIAMNRVLYKNNNFKTSRNSKKYFRQKKWMICGI